MANFYILPATRRAVLSFNSSGPADAPTFIQGDTEALGVYLLEDNDGVLPYNFLELEVGETLEFAVGLVEGKPTGGEVTLGYGADSTSPLAYPLSAADLETALNGLASIIAAGLVDVTGVDGGPWRVVFRVAGVRTLIFGSSDLLFPDAEIYVSTLREEDVGSASIQLIKVVRSPLSLTTTFAETAPASVTVETIRVGDDAPVPINAIQRITLDPLTYGGTFTFNGSAAIAYNTALTDFQTALDAIEGTGKYLVTQAAKFQWDVEFIGTNGAQAQTLKTATAGGLLVPFGYLGELDLANSRIKEFLSGVDSSAVSVQVRKSSVDGKKTIWTSSATLNNSLLEDSPVSANPAIAYVTEVDALAWFEHTADRRSGLVAVPISQNYVDVTFSAMASAPTRVSGLLKYAAETDEAIYVIGYINPTTTTVRFLLSATTSISTFFLSYEVKI